MKFETAFGQSFRHAKVQMQKTRHQAGFLLESVLVMLVFVLMLVTVSVAGM